MFENIVQAIICSEFNRIFGRGRVSLESQDKNKQTLTDPDHAMVVKFSLSPDYDVEDGYRNLSLLIFGGGSNYISVFSKLDWNVAPLSPTGEALQYTTLPTDDPQYTKGETPWVLEGCHDSCWRDAVGRLLRDYRERIITIDWVFGGWYKTVSISAEEKRQLSVITRNTPGYGGSGDRTKLSDLEFKFAAQ